ncbi:glycosyltransferase family 4 protein [Polynucleobacter paneuropaeus]|nr:glycosyltransferase family 4 protein [Polynucleobacter paneuropaeus]MBT8544369.1 glycosyltransferase family 4 protein [Polynucleobacter paneuropaeus]MBT8555569.1 glycosyltransferase family 4 protein [Polynucleobacter paneuropaeus]MBT8560845.1 glycosyltransferase family 4 protein [Polynucleobacter paneuropaeus]
MKSIAIVAHQAFALINFRHSLIIQLISKGHEVFALAPDFSDAQITTLKNLGAIPISYRLSRTGNNPFKDFRDTLSLAFLLRKLNPDIFLGFSIKPVIFGTIAALIAQIPHRVAMIEGLGYLFTNDNQKKSIKRSFLLGIAVLLYRVSLSRADTVIFLNQDDIEYFISHKLVSPNKPVNLDGIGVDLNAWEMMPPVLSPVTFIMVARLLKEKGVMEYIAAVKQLRTEGLSARFLLLGDVDSNPSSIPLSVINEHVALNEIEWFGHVDVKPWIQQSSVFVLPSYREGVPRSSLEAMSMGRPVITTNVPGCRETVIDGVNGYLIPPFDVDALSNAMRHFIHKPHLIESMGAQSRSIVESRFNVIDKDNLLMQFLKLS